MYTYNKSNVNTLSTQVFFFNRQQPQQPQTSHCAGQPTKPEVNIRNESKVTCNSGYSQVSFAPSCIFQVNIPDVSANCVQNLHCVLPGYDTVSSSTVLATFRRKYCLSSGADGGSTQAA
jgi:hypothetical protein